MVSRKASVQIRFSVKNVVMARPIGVAEPNAESELPEGFAAYLKQLFLQCRLGAYQCCG